MRRGGSRWTHETTDIVAFLLSSPEYRHLAVTGGLIRSLAVAPGLATWFIKIETPEGRVGWDDPGQWSSLPREYLRARAIADGCYVRTVLLWDFSAVSAYIEKIAGHSCWNCGFVPKPRYLTRHFARIAGRGICGRCSARFRRFCDRVLARGYGASRFLRDFDRTGGWEASMEAAWGAHLLEREVRARNKTGGLPRL